MCISTLNFSRKYMCGYQLENREIWQRQIKVMLILITSDTCKCVPYPCKLQFRGNFIFVFKPVINKRQLKTLKINKMWFFASTRWCKLIRQSAHFYAANSSSSRDQTEEMCQCVRVSVRQNRHPISLNEKHIQLKSF